MKRTIPTIAWLLFGVLAVGGTLISISKRDNVADPRMDSYGPSGLAAFADLLRSNGYQVAANYSDLPQFQKGDVVIACINESREIDITPDATGVYRRLDTFVRSGGSMLLLPIEPSFGEGSLRMASIQVASRMSDRKLTVKMRSINGEPEVRYSLPEDLVSVGLWDCGENPVAWLTQDGKGTVVSAWDGYLATNRFIDHDANADLLMNLVTTIAPKGGRIVFVNAAYDPKEPSLIAILGPGATAGWYQALFLFVVVVFTLGKRFGVPEEERPAQQGQRELINAVADTYLRAKSTKTACRAAYDRADFEVRKALKLSADAPTSERDQRIPAELSQQLRKVFEANIDTVTPQEAFERCRILQRHLKDFLRRN